MYSAQTHRMAGPNASGTASSGKRPQRPCGRCSTSRHLALCWRAPGAATFDTWWKPGCGALAYRVSQRCGAMPQHMCCDSGSVGDGGLTGVPGIGGTAIGRAGSTSFTAATDATGMTGASSVGISCSTTMGRAAVKRCSRSCSALNATSRSRLSTIISLWIATFMSTISASIALRFELTSCSR